MEKKFIPKPGQVDYTNIRWAPVVNCVVRYRGKILLVQRGANLHLYPGYWNGISGFLDDHQSLEEKVLTELSEELGLRKTQIRSIRSLGVFDQEAPRYLKTWVVHAVLVDVKTDQIEIDWEAQRAVWMTMAEAKKLKLLPGFDQVLALVAKKGRSRG